MVIGALRLIHLLVFQYNFQKLWNTGLCLAQALTCYASLAQAQERLWTWRRRTVLYVNLMSRIHSETSVILDFCIMDPRI